MLEDLAILSGGQVVSEPLGLSMEQVTPERLGRARRVEVSKDHTTVVGGGGDPQVIAERMIAAKPAPSGAATPPAADLY